jgi:hypothetical protein
VRIHDDFPEFALWRYGDAERALAQPANIAIARFECVERGGAAFGMLDLVLQSSALHTVICGLQIDLLAAARNDEGAISYPRAARALVDDESAAVIAAFLVPQLRLLMRRREVPLEEIVRFAPSPAFERARERGELGAAPLTIALPRIARWRDALRLARGAAVAIASDECDLGAAVAAHSGMPLTRASRAPAGDWFSAPVAFSDDPAALSVSDTLANAMPAPLQVVFTEPPPMTPARSVAIVAPLLLDRPYATDPCEGPIATRYWIIEPRSADRVPGNTRR